MADARLSCSERRFIVSGVQEDFRSDGRACEDYRYFEVETGIVSNTSGSARVKLSKTDILVGVKAEIGEPNLKRPKEGRVEFFVDCSSNASPEFNGRGGEDLAADLSRAMERSFNNRSAIDLPSLSIIPGQQCWVIYIDALVLECGSGNLYDILSIAIKAALHNTSIPNVTVTTDGGDVELEISDDPHDCKRLNVDNTPIIITLSKIGLRHVVDASMEEEACSDCHLLVSVNGSGNICSQQKIGAGGMDPQTILEMLDSARNVGKTINKKLLEVLEEETSSIKRNKVGFLN
ncbi:exosome complex exonuclease RRP42-like [Actinia tenebrosa]|uniref:Ribosomal RNA-processing protein 42 n=1 Tax=Actinia tenebrosa TaxID=6105 RepID=A0A6P8I6Z1_ACTTE|nr:exosome complex exonuclease RRP42-like [Actinia tenebrosa]